MSNGRFQLLFFVLFVLLVLGINVFVFLPYFSVLFLALVFAIVFSPFHERILSHFPRHESLSAMIATFAVGLIIVGPIFFFGTLLFKEASDLYVNLQNTQNVEPFLSRSGDFLEKLFPTLDVKTGELDVTNYMSKGLSWILSHLSVLFGGVLKLFAGLLLMLLALFYFFRDGKKFLKALVELSPLNDTHDNRIANKMILAVNSVVSGHIIVGLIQGILSGLGFAIFGVPSPVLWGAVAAVASLVPSVGTALVIVPAVLLLFFSGASGSALGLLIWGSVAVGLIDNLLAPVLVRRKVQIHPLLILLSALGGVAFFGPIGFLAGPVFLALLFALFDIYPDIVRGRAD